MADDTTRLSRSAGTDRGNSGHALDEDPLVELARIVSDDGQFFQNAPGKPVSSPESGPRPNPFSIDLEAELMEEFETSFADGVAGAPNSAQTDVPAPEVESVSEDAHYTANDSQALSAMAAEADTQSEENFSTAYEHSKVKDAAATDDRIALIGTTGRVGNDLPSDSLADLLAHPPADFPGKPTVEPAIEPIDDPVHVALDDAIDSIAAGEPHPGRFETEFADALNEADSQPLTENFTPEFGVEAYGREPEFHGGQPVGDGPVADQTDYSASHDHSPPHHDGAAANGRDGGYRSGPGVPPPVPVRTGGRKGLIAIAGVLAVVVLGGGVAAYIGKSAPNDPATPAPVIKAETGDIKILANAPDTAATAPSVLDQLAGQQAKSEEKLIDRIEKPQQIARVAMPGPGGENTTRMRKAAGEQAREPTGSVADSIGKTIDRVIQEGGQNSGQPSATPAYDPIGPRKVRTVVVKADGSIVPNDNASAPALPSLPAKPALPPLETMEIPSGDTAQAPKPTPVKTMNITSVPLPGDTIGILDSSPRPTQMTTAEPSAPVIDFGEAMAPPIGAFPRTKPADVPASVVAPAPTRTAARSTREPVNLLAAPDQTNRPRATASTGQNGYVVQVSSQRSADQAQASFSEMQRRYKSILGGLEANIVRADLGAKGTFYRVRIGPMANREAALRLCQQLKSAGGNCFVTR